MSKTLTVEKQREKPLWIQFFSGFFLFIFSVISLFTHPLKAQYYPLKGEHICLPCWLATQQIGRYLTFNSSTIQEGQYDKAGEKNVLMIFPTQHAETLSEMQADESVRLKRLLEASETGSKLLNLGNSRSVSLQFFYQQARDQNLQPHMGRLTTEDLFEREKADPQELWSFYVQGPRSTSIYINDYQTPSRAVLSLAHELAHTVDPVSLSYAQKYTSQWRVLDSLVLEVRALFLESKVLQELLAQNIDVLGALKTDPSFNSAIRTAKDLRAPVIKKAQELLTPSLNPSTLMAEPFRSGTFLGWSYRAGVRQQEIPLDEPDADFQSVFVRLLHWHRNPQISFQYLSALIKYRQADPAKLSQTRQSRGNYLKELNSSLRERGAESLEQYLERENVFSLLSMGSSSLAGDSDSLRFGPSPRVNGGDRSHSIIEMNRPTDNFPSIGQHGSGQSRIQPQLNGSAGCLAESAGNADECRGRSKKALENLNSGQTGMERWGDRR